MTSSLLRPAGSLGFPNMGQTPPIMAPGQMPTNTGVVPPTPAPAAAAPPAPAAAQGPAGHGHQMLQHPGFGGMPGLLSKLAMPGFMAGLGQRHPDLLSALTARFGQPAAAPAPAAVAQPAAIAAPAAAPVLNRPVDRI